MNICSDFRNKRCWRFILKEKIQSGQEIYLHMNKKKYKSKCKLNNAFIICGSELLILLMLYDLGAKQTCRMFIVHHLTYIYRKIKYRHHFRYLHNFEWLVTYLAGLQSLFFFFFSIKQMLYMILKFTCIHIAFICVLEVTILHLKVKYRTF